MSDRDDLEATYRDYDHSGRSVERWSSTNPGNRAIHAERNARFESLLAACAAEAPLSRLLEVGCGGGSLLTELAVMPPLRSASCVGVDLLAFRLVAGMGDGMHLPIAQADGRHLPFESGAFEVVVLSTVLSSIAADESRRTVASEVDRVLQPGGSVIWYDMRYPSPTNRRVVPLGRRRVLGLFPEYAAEMTSLTVIPQLARRLGDRTESGYRALRGVPLLRSHLAGRLRKPS